MNRAEAKQALASGKRLRHSSFTSEEWVQGYGLHYLFEDGCLCYLDEFWRYR